MQLDVPTNIHVFKLNLIVDFYVWIGYSRMFFKENFHKMDHHPVLDNLESLPILAMLDVPTSK